MDSTERVERRDRRGFGFELARIVPAAAARAGQTGLARYAARSAGVIPTTSARNVSRAPSGSPGGKPVRQAGLDPGRVVADPGRRRSTLVADDATDGIRAQRGPERAASAVRVSDHIHGAVVFRGEGICHGRDVLELTLDRVGERVAGGATPAPIDGMDWP